MDGKPNPLVGQRCGVKKLEVFLLAALALVWAAQAVWVPKPDQPSVTHGRQNFSWRQQEKQAQERIRRTMETNRQTLEMKIRRDRPLWWRFQVGLLLLLFVALGALVQWGIVVLRQFAGTPPEPPQGNPPPPEWGGRQIFRLVLGILLLIQCFAWIQRFLFYRFRPAWLDHRVGALTETLLVDVLAAAGAGGFFLTRSRRQGKALDPGKIFPAIRFAFRRYFFSVPLLALLLFTVAWVLNLFRIEPAPQPIFTLYLSEERTRVVRFLLLLAVVAGPIAEEMFFRGFLYGWLRKRIGVRQGLFLSAFLFALLHMDAVAFFPILGLGLLFGWVYEQTGSLAAPISIHIFHNAGMLYLASLVKAMANSG